MTGITQLWDGLQWRGLSAGMVRTWVTALELRSKKRFVLTRVESEGLLSTMPVNHKTPLCRGPACLFAAQGASGGRPRAGVSFMIQQTAGLRPSGLLRLFPEHVIFQS